jgi:hypothetical protein
MIWRRLEDSGHEQALSMQQGVRPHDRERGIEARQRPPMSVNERDLRVIPGIGGVQVESLVGTNVALNQLVTRVRANDEARKSPGLEL